MTFHVPDNLRIRAGRQASDETYGNNGAFFIKASIGSKRAPMFAIASDGAGWEHVSVSTQYRCPTWGEMCHIKSLFWDDEDCVIQFHPPRSEYVNCHPFCLHLWRQIGGKVELPPFVLVGPVRESA